MEFQENKAGKPFRQSPFLLMFILPYRLWRAWRRRAETRKILSGLSEARLKDIGLSCDDVERFK